MWSPATTSSPHAEQQKNQETPHRASQQGAIRLPYQLTASAITPAQPWLGTAIVIASGLYVGWRQTRR
jgi:hypothetical protein